MGKRDQRVDAHIAKAGDFAKPILEYIRETAHAAVPDVEETIKWSMPFFEHDGPLAMMAAFKQHVRFGFWRGKIFDNVKSVKDLPPKKQFLAMFRKAARSESSGSQRGSRGTGSM
ncbi:MAG TPA: DUF1801 domain-containing protein [Thermoanaerobaculia bacterium]|nr:DUF1801 domain-containing protein [Thermoanaerobaculia bacterium]